MTDMDDIHDHVEGLNDPDLYQYLRTAMREGDTARAAAADMEVRSRRSED